MKEVNTVKKIDCLQTVFSYCNAVKWQTRSSHFTQWLRCRLGHIHPISEGPSSSPNTAPDTSFLLMHTLRSTGDVSSPSVPATPVEDPDWAPVYGFNLAHPQLLQAFREWASGWEICLSVSVCFSNKKI